MNTTEDVTPQRMREILSHFASGLTIIASSTENRPLGFSCQSFA